MHKEKGKNVVENWLGTDGLGVNTCEDCSQHVLFPRIQLLNKLPISTATL